MCIHASRYKDIDTHIYICNIHLYTHLYIYIYIYMCIHLYYYTHLIFQKDLEF